MQYLILIEETMNGASADFQDVPGCVSTGATQVEVTVNMQEALAFQVEGMQLEGLEVPLSPSHSAFVEIAA